VDAGTYTCTATNRLGYIEAAGTLLVRSKYTCLYVSVCCTCEKVKDVHTCRSLWQIVSEL